MRSPLLALVLPLASCAAEVRVVKAPDGHAWYDVGCSGAMADCYAQARKACGGRAYEVMESTTPSVEGASATLKVSPDTRVLVHRPDVDVEMLVQCSGDDAGTTASASAREAIVCAKPPLMRANMDESIHCPPP
jgi:hypothetical protein